MQGNRGIFGFSLIEALIAIGMTGILIVVASTGLRTYFATNKHIKIKGQVLDVRAYLRNKMDCAKTLTPLIAAGQCDNAQYVTLKDASDANIVLADASAKIGGYKIRSQCETLGGFYGIHADYLPVNPDGSTAKDPMTRKTAGWKSLFPTTPIACASPGPASACSALEEGRSVFLNGAGTSVDPFRICTLAHLDQVRGNLTAFYKIMKDIDASSTQTGEGWNPISGNFMKTLDGNGKTIINLWSNRPLQDEVGLFQFCLGGTVKSLNMTGVKMVGKMHVGGVVARTSHCTLRDLQISGVVQANPSNMPSFVRAGLIVGHSYNDNIENVIASGSTTANAPGNALAGLIAGSGFSQVIINNVRATGTVTTTSGNAKGGLIIGRLGGGTISKAVASGTVNVTGGTGAYAGGIAGEMYISGVSTPCALSDSYSQATVTSTTSNWSWTGGAVGYVVGNNSVGTPVDCVLQRVYATGNLIDTGGPGSGASNANVGTLVGCMNMGQVIDSFGTGNASWNGSTNGAGRGGLVGRINAPPNSGLPPIVNSFWLDHAGNPDVCTSTTPYTCTAVASASAFYNGSTLTPPTSAMFANWDFATIWRFPGGGYPQLR